MKALPREYYLQDTLFIAKDLIGKYLVRKYNHNYIIGRITETEAYIGLIDKACHAYAIKLLHERKLYMKQAV